MQENVYFFNFTKFMGTVTPSGSDFHSLVLRAVLWMPCLSLHVLLCLTTFPETITAASSRRPLSSQNNFFALCPQAANVKEARDFLAGLRLCVRRYEQASLPQGDEPSRLHYVFSSHGVPGKYECATIPPLEMETESQAEYASCLPAAEQRVEAAAYCLLH